MNDLININRSVSVWTNWSLFTQYNALWERWLGQRWRQRFTHIDVISLHHLKCLCIRSFSGPYFPVILAEYVDLLCQSPYSVRIRKNTDNINSEYEQIYVEWFNIFFSTSLTFLNCIFWHFQCSVVVNRTQ